MLIVVLETHPTKQFLYKYLNVGDNPVTWKIKYIRFEKDNKSNRNPAVNLSNSPISMNRVVEFVSVDIIETFINYARIKKSYNDDKLRLRITNAIITNSYLWLYLYVSINVEIIIKNCHFKQTKLNMPYPDKNPLINITIENTILEGSLVMEMDGGIAHFKNCTFKDTPVRPDTSLLSFRDSQVTIHSCRFSNIFFQNFMPSHKFNNKSEKAISPKQNAFVITGNMCNRKTIRIELQVK